MLSCRFPQYACSKACNILHTRELQDRYQQDRGIIATSVSPGFVNTTIFRCAVCCYHHVDERIWETMHQGDWQAAFFSAVHINNVGCCIRQQVGTNLHGPCWASTAGSCYDPHHALVAVHCLVLCRSLPSYLGWVARGLAPWVGRTPAQVGATRCLLRASS
jgi:hypothetical protein